jgi:hypothetical protein
MTVAQCFRELATRPGELLLRRWNWKSAVFSSIIRALIFFFANIRSGWHAAFGALFAELLYRGVTAGFYGALTQAFGEVEPEWAAGVTVSLLLPVVSHAIEFGVHWLRGTPHLKASIISSASFTILSTLFNVYAMRRGVLVVGYSAGSVGSDMRRIPRLIAGFVACAPIALYRCFRRAFTAPVEEAAELSD